MAKRIFDCFTFFNELEVLKIRLAELYRHVDYFILVEAPVTFQGQKKALVFQQNRQQFADYLDKIIHVVVDDMPEGQSPWAREHFQRNAVRRGLPADIWPSDIVIVSDVDEILRRSTVDALRERDGYFMLEMPMYHFFINALAAADWNKPYAFSFALSDRIPDLSEVRTHQLETFQRFGASAHKIANAGWHFTFLGGPERVREKLRAYSHTGVNYQKLLAPGAVEEVLRVGNKLGGADITRFVEVDDSFPEAVRKNIKFYRANGFVKDVLPRLRELEDAYVNEALRAQRMDKDYRALLGRLAGLLQAGGELTAPYRLPEYSQVSFSRQNLIPDSKGFSRGWGAGTQTVKSSPTAEVPALQIDNVVLKHVRDDPATTRENNLGWFRIAGLSPGATFTASCYVWLPPDLDLHRLGIYLEGGSPLTTTTADPTVRGRWQRIWESTIIPPDAVAREWVVSLRLAGNSAGALYSTCWQLEVGPEPTPYVAGGSGE